MCKHDHITATAARLLRCTTRAASHVCGDNGSAPSRTLKLWTVYKAGAAVLPAACTVNALVQTDMFTLFRSRPPMLVVAASHSFSSVVAHDERGEGLAVAVETITRIRRDFGLLPGLALTLPQVRRLWGLPDTECRELLDALVADGFLRVRPDARYVMRSPPFRLHSSTLQG